MVVNGCTCIYVHAHTYMYTHTYLHVCDLCTHCVHLHVYVHVCCSKALLFTRSGGDSWHVRHLLALQPGHTSPDIPKGEGHCGNLYCPFVLGAPLR